jgi:hypothetical protein
MHWNGTQWSVVPTPNPGGQNYNELRDVVAIASNDVWAVGYFYPGVGEAARTLIEHWDGTSWKVVKSPNIGTTSNLAGITAATPTNLWAVGYSYSIDTSDTSALLLHFVAGKWKLAPAPPLGAGDHLLFGVSAISANEAWAVGYQELYPNPEQTLALHWNGTAWSAIPSPNKATDYGSSDRLIDIAAVSSNDVYAVGWYASEFTNHFQHRTMVQRWNGNAWTVTSSASPGKSADLEGVSALATGGVWAAGLYSIYGYDIYSRSYIVPSTLMLKK